MWNKLTYFLLITIVCIAAFLRFYKLGELASSAYKFNSIPVSLNWDEVAAGYNAYTIANWGMDEYGNKFPIVFTSFYDDKHPVHIYITAVLVKVFGLSDYVVRSGGALVGVFSVIAIFFLARELLKNNIAALFSSLFLALSQYSIHFSRGLWENNFALFFLTAGIALFYVGIRKRNYLIPIAFSFFGLSFFSYHSAKVVAPIVVFLTCLINIKALFRNKLILIASVLVVLLFGILIIKEPKILGFARMNQTKFSDEQIQKAGSKTKLIFENYKKHFTYEYLFRNGDQGPRASVKVIGQFYKIDLILSIIGLAFLVYKKKWQALVIILTWLLVAPIPSSVSSIDPSAIRGVFMIIPILLLSAFGASSLVGSLQNRIWQVLVVVLILFFLGKESTNYLNYYSNIYPIKEAIEWQYGMKEIVRYSEENPSVYKMYIDNIRQQPYIYFLYYLKVPLPEFLKTVRYEETESKSFSTVRSFGKYQFGGWNIIESYPNEGILYTITPSYYTGLRYIQQFDVVKQIKYPDMSDAFYMVTGHQL